MITANIEKVRNVVQNITRSYETLTKADISKLRRRTLGHGNMKAAMEATGLTRNTIMKAREGGKILSTTAEKLRSFIG